MRCGPRARRVLLGSRALTGANRRLLIAHPGGLRHRISVSGADPDAASAQHPSHAFGRLAFAGYYSVRSKSRDERAYLDVFGNRVTRVDVPPGLVTFSNRFVIYDSGELDETPPDTDSTPIVRL